MILQGKWTGPIVDQHIHLDRSGRFLSAAEEFSRAGGTGIMLVHKPAIRGKLPIDLGGYRSAYAETLSMAEEVRNSVGLEVGVVLGPHPVVWEHQIQSLGLERSTELHLEAVGLALEHIEAGQANCLGEVGRPHYPVDQDTWTSATDMLLDIMRMASSTKCSIQLHVESNGEATCRELAGLCDRAGLPRDRAIRHYAPSDVSPEFTHGMAATVSVGQGSIEGLTSTATSQSSPWGMETDFLDDPSRPGAVLGPKTIPKRTHELCSALLHQGWEAEDVTSLMYSIHSRWPDKLYSIR
tara:strand:- start:292 stop:1179 length:888 start_codon:yes stop_codon:yes gene_type:complete